MNKTRQTVETVNFLHFMSSSDRMKHNTSHTAYIQGKRAKTQRHITRSGR